MNHPQSNPNLQPLSVTSMRDQHAAIVRIAILSIVCAGAWFIIVTPKQQAVAIRRDQIARVETQLSRGITRQAGYGDPCVKGQELRKVAVSLRDFTKTSADPATLYDTYRAFAEEYGVRIDRVEPRIIDGRRNESMTKRIVYTIDISGTYEAVTRMLNAVETRVGATRIMSFRMTPSPKPNADESVGHDWVSASIETLHLELTLPDSILRANASPSSYTPSSDMPRSDLPSTTKRDSTPSPSASPSIPTVVGEAK